MSPSSKSRLAPYWTTKQSLANSLVQFGCIGHQTPKSKVNGPRVHFPYNLPLFDDWWQHDQSKQMIEILNFKNYLLARMQCKGQGYMMLENPTQIPIEDHLALTKVPMCHYGFLQILPLLSLIHNPLSSLSWTITTCRHQLDACLWSFKFSPFGIKHRKGRH